MKRTDSEIHKNSFSNKSSEQQSTIIKAIKHNILFQNCSE